MMRNIGAWLLVAAAVPACGTEIDVGGPRSTPEAEGGAISDTTSSKAGKSALPDPHESPSESGYGGASEGPSPSAGSAPSEAGAGSTEAGGADPGTSTEGGSGNASPTGAFKVLVLSKTLEFPHVSITHCQQLLVDLGQTPDALLPEGASPGSQFTVDIAKEDLSDFTDAKLKKYSMLFWCNPTGRVFSSAGTSGAIGMAAIQKFVEAGGAWGGVHAATDFELSNGFPWFTNTLVGASFMVHDADGTAGTVQVDAGYAEHPVMRGLPAPWNTNDEWYTMNRDVRAVPGIQVLASLASDSRPVVWTNELGPNGDGRMFYTTRGHAESVYREAAFKRLVHNGILWATHRME
jgi:type 1 glutamine amidotransferase